MTDLKLFHAPGACSRVTMTALEVIGCAYEDELIDFQSGGHRQPAFLALNPRGKVPALLIDGALLTENVAILTWLDRTYPEARLLPTAADPLAAARQLGDLVWMSATWHPYVRANMMPMLWTTGETEPVRERGKLLLAPLIAELDARLAGQSWYYGDEWSIVDMYLYWCYTRAEQGAYSLDGQAGIARHRQAIEASPAYAKLLAREQAAKARAAAIRETRP